jgi:hypothetical protein
VVTITAATAFGTGASAGSLTATVTTPSGAVAGDILVIYACRGTAATTWSAPGFTAVTAATGSNGAGQVLYRVLDGSGSDPGATFTLTCSASAIFAGICVRVSTSGGTFDPAATSGQVNVSSTNIPAAGITTTRNGDLIIWAGGIDAGAGGTPAVITLPAGYSDSGAGQSNTSNGAGTNVGVLCGSVLQAAAGATGTVTGTGATAHVNMAVLLGIAPAAAGGDDGGIPLMKLLGIVS